MANIQDRIRKNSEYFRSIEMASTYPILRVKYPEKWGVYPSNDGRIKVTRSEDTPNEWYYYTTDESVTLDNMFDMLEQTVDMNLSAISKIQLLKEKVEELKELFSSETLERLQTLYFGFETKKKKSSRKPKKEFLKEEENNNAEEKVTEECLG